MDRFAAADIARLAAREPDTALEALRELGRRYAAGEELSDPITCDTNNALEAYDHKAESGFATPLEDELAAALRAAEADRAEMERQKDGWLRSALDAKDMHRDQVEWLNAELAQLRVIVNELANDPPSSRPASRLYEFKERARDAIATWSRPSDQP